jgi:hypothetical protein
MAAEQSRTAETPGGGVRVDKDSVVARLGDGPIRLPLISAPEELTTWLDEGRRAMYEQILDDSTPVRFFAQHLPMVVTYNSGSVFPFTCGNKGVGYVPRAEHVEGLTARYREVLEASKGKPWRESLALRVQTAADFNLKPALIDRRCLVTLEIFERQTFQNLQETPLASLLFTGHSPRFISFQVNCAVELIGPGDPRYTFITLARTMFEYDEFHITQHNFPYAYVFWISESISKTPFRVSRGDAASAQFDRAELTMPWDDEALEAVARAPGMIQAHVRTLVEGYARDRGFTRVTATIVQEARENLMDGR